MPVSRGDVVLVPFRFSNQVELKWRPAVVVSSATYNQGADVMVASITSNLRAVVHAGDHRVVNWQGAGLARPSLAQAKITTIDAGLIGRKLGTLDAADLATFDQGLRAALDLV